ncbi:MAG: rod-binding protein [Spirochaetales bacterium]|nr:rod-binding protein [Spirochaetales bacterium]
MDLVETGRIQFDQSRIAETAKKAERMAVQDREKLMEACRQFESIFIKQMLNSMKKTVSKSGMLNGGLSEEIFEDMLYDQYAEKMSKTANFGIADMLYKQFS